MRPIKWLVEKFRRTHVERTVTLRNALKCLSGKEKPPGKLQLPPTAKQKYIVLLHTAPLPLPQALGVRHEHHADPFRPPRRREAV